MKTLVDGTAVSARTYYYLLDFNDRFNWEFINRNFDKTSLYELTIDEYRQFFNHATDVDKVSLL